MKSYMTYFTQFSYFAMPIRSLNSFHTPFINPLSKQHYTFFRKNFSVFFLHFALSFLAEQCHFYLYIETFNPQCNTIIFILIFRSISKVSHDAGGFDVNNLSDSTSNDICNIIGAGIKYCEPFR